MRHDPLASGIVPIAPEHLSPANNPPKVRKAPKRFKERGLQSASPPKTFSHSADGTLALLIPGSRFKTVAEARTAIADYLAANPGRDFRHAWNAVSQPSQPIKVPVHFTPAVPIPIPLSQPSTSHWRSRYAHHPSQS